MDGERLLNVTRRGLGALAVGVIVAGGAYLLAFRNLRSNLASFQYKGVAAIHDLDVIEKAVEDYRKAAGRLPVGLAELTESVDQPSLNGDPIRAVDPWGHPYHYRVEGDRFVLDSHGRDGRAGGVGIDADVYPRSAGRRFEPATFRQFVFDLDSGMGRIACVLAGIFAGVVCFTSAGKFRGRELFFSVIATMVGAAFVGSFLCALHILPGH